MCNPLAIISMLECTSPESDAAFTIEIQNLLMWNISFALCAESS